MRPSVITTHTFSAIDYSKAFDKIDINVALLQDCLTCMSDQSCYHGWRISYQTEGNACAWAKRPHEWISTTCGVPQGTQVGPVVFLAMVNHIAFGLPFSLEIR